MKESCSIIYHPKNTTQQKPRAGGWQVCFIWSSSFSQCCESALFCIKVRFSEDKNFICIFGEMQASHFATVPTVFLSILTQAAFFLPGGSWLFSTRHRLLELQMEGSTILFLPFHHQPTKQQRHFPKSPRFRSDMSLEPVILSEWRESCSSCLRHCCRQSTCLTKSTALPNPCNGARK